MQQGTRRASPQLACWALLALLLLLPACTNSPAPERPEPVRKVDTAMFSEAEAYERFMGRWSRCLAPPFIKFAGLKDGDRVLDVGSGTGAMALSVLQEAPASRVVGIDPSPAYVAHARTRAGGGRATFEEGDAQRLRFPDGSFDAALALLVVNFIPDGRPRCARWPA
jgi:ubiquinone/menaquinone biosynthesis C-methylase UbiE